MVLPSPARPPASSGTRLPRPRPGRRPARVSLSRPAAGRPLPTPERRWGASGQGGGGRGGCPGVAADSGGKRASPRGLPARQRPRGPGLSAGLSRGDRAGRSPKEESARLLPSLAGCSGTCWISGTQCRHPRPSSLRRQLAPCGLHAAGRRTRGGGGSDPWGPRWSRL